MRIKDLTGQRFGRLVAQRIVSHKPVKWECICDCGNTTIVSSTHLTTGHTLSCGCYGRERTSITNLKDLTGKRFGRLFVINKTPFGHITPKGQELTQYQCICDCGNFCHVLGMNLVTGNTQSCGCYGREQASKAFLNDITGMRFGRLTVIKRAANRGERTYWVCRCDCGTIKEVWSQSLVRGNTKSCGCIKSSAGEALTRDFLDKNGIRYTPEYWFDDLRSNSSRKRPLRFDFALLDQDDNVVCLLEYQGEQHYYEIDRNTDFGKQQREVTDPMKREYCEINGIPLFEIRFDDELEPQLDNAIQFYNKIIHSKVA